MKMGKPWETVWLDGETMGKHGVSPSGWYFFNDARKKRPSPQNPPYVCQGNSSVIQIHRDSLHLSIIFSAPYPILNQNLRYLMLYVFRQITSLQKDIYIYATPWNNTYKGVMFYFLPSYYIITEGYISATRSNTTYKGLRMGVFYLIQNTRCAKGPLSTREPRIQENQKLTSRTLPRLRRGLLKTPVVLPEKT
jgi:hypothetical protein